MELYTLDETFQKDTVVEGYSSAIWTERFSKNGDVNIVMPASAERIALLAEGKFLAERDSDEIMIIDSQLVEDGDIKVVGKTLEAFFNERYFVNSADHSVNEWAARDHPGSILSQMVNVIVINANAPGLAELGGVLNKIPFLILGDIDISDPIVSRKVPFGPMYDAMLPIAETYRLGMRVYLSRSDAFGYELTFSVYKGVDRTSAQLENDLIRFSPAQDSMTGTSQLNSIAGYKNVVYLYPPSWSTTSTAPIVVYAPGVDPTVTGFGRRILVAQASDIEESEVTGGVTLSALMNQKATDLLANNNYTKLVDGEVVPQPEYVYGENYNLGDLIELQGPDGSIQKAQITEYIRSKDATGERAYPTVSVVD